MKDGVQAVTRRAVLGGAFAVPALVRSARADQTVALVSHRYPALEYYADKMKTAVPGAQIDARLMPSGDAMQLQRLAFSSHADSMDLLWVNGVLTMNYAKNGWIQPLDDLFEKYRTEFRLDDIAPASLRGVTYKGRIYALPLTTNTLLYAYRGDIFQERKLQPAKTW
jgi:multiple sugar transport system substrate-binding protein